MILFANGKINKGIAPLLFLTNYKRGLHWF